MTAQTLQKIIEWIGASVSIAAGVALIAWLVAYSVSRFSIAWKNAKSWEYIRKAVREYGQNHPDERNVAEKREGISRRKGEI